MKRNAKFLSRCYEDLQKHLNYQRVLIIYGPRRVGKTTLLESFLDKVPYKYLLNTGDTQSMITLFEQGELSKLLEHVEGYELLAIDEAQMLPKVGQCLKMIVDHAKDLYVVVTGSSSFDLTQKTGEPLTGRKKTLTLYPFAQMELIEEYTKTELRNQLENFLIFGHYPDVLKAKTKVDKIEVLQELVDSYLLKDILTLEKVKSSSQILKLLQLLAFQIGQLVSVHELATQLQLNTKTVMRYLDLLEKSFVICQLGAFSKNLRREITKKSKYYFLDIGIRNAVIKQYNPIDQRNDIGALFENFIVMERLKKTTYERFYGNRYFWRTYQGQEVDLIEEQDGQLHAYEIKWSTTKKVQLPKAWKEAYPDAKNHVITPDNYFDYVLPSS